MHAYRAAAAVSSNGAGSKIIFDTETVDTHNAYNNSTGVFTAPYAGDYFISIGGGNIAATSTVMYWYVKRNSSTIRQGTVWNPSNANNRQTLTTTVSLAASDTIECWYVGGGGSVIAVGQENLFLDINYLP